MGFPAELAVPVEVRLLDVGARLERAFRLSRAIGLDGVSFERALPFDAGRPVRASLTLPDDRDPIEVTGVVRRESTAIAFTDVQAGARERILRYLRERTEPQ